MVLQVGFGGGAHGGSTDLLAIVIVIAIVEFCGACRGGHEVGIEFVLDVAEG